MKFLLKSIMIILLICTAFVSVISPVSADSTVGSFPNTYSANTYFSDGFGQPSQQLMATILESRIQSIAAVNRAEAINAMLTKPIMVNTVAYRPAAYHAHSVTHSHRRHHRTKAVGYGARGYTVIRSCPSGGCPR